MTENTKSTSKAKMWIWVTLGAVVLGIFWGRTVCRVHPMTRPMWCAGTGPIIGYTVEEDFLLYESYYEQLHRR